MTSFDFGFNGCSADEYVVGRLSYDSAQNVSTNRHDHNKHELRMRHELMIDKQGEWCSVCKA